MNVGIEHLLDLPFDLATDEDESAGGQVVVCGLDEDGVDELYGQEWEGSEFGEVGACEGGGVGEGRSGGGAAARGEEGKGGAVIWRKWRMVNLKIVSSILGSVLA